MRILKYELDKEDNRKIVWLALRQSWDGIMVHVIDEKGEHIEAGNIMKFRNNGMIERQDHINDTLGFQLDERGRIKEEEVEG